MNTIWGIYDIRILRIIRYKRLPASEQFLLRLCRLHIYIIDSTVIIFLDAADVIEVRYNESIQQQEYYVHYEGRKLLNPILFIWVVVSISLFFG